MTSSSEEGTSKSTETALENFLLDRPRHVSFTPHRASLVAARNGELYKDKQIDEGSLRLFYEVKLAKRERVEIPGGEGLEKLNGQVSVSMGPIGLEGDPKACGSLLYWSEYESEFSHSAASYQAQVLVTPRQFTELLDAARAGLMPTDITIGVMGLEFGPSPDGSDKVWKSVEGDSAALPIRSATFVFRLAEAPNAEPDEDADDEPIMATAATRADLERAANQISAAASVSAEGVRRTVSSLLWVVVVLGILVLVFKH